MAQTDLASALDPTKKPQAPVDPNAPAVPGAQPGAMTNATPPPPPAPAAPTGDPFAAMGGGTNVNGGWIPNNNPAAITAAGGTAPAAPAAPGATTGPAPPTIASAFQGALLSRMGQSPTVSATDPSVAPQIQQNQIVNQRSFERRRAMSAERAAQDGTLNSGGFDANLDTLASARGDSEAAGQNQILGDANRQRQQEILQALTLGGNRISEQERIAANQELAQLDAAIRREGLSAQTSLGQGDLALRAKQGDMSAMLQLLGLQQNNDQFGKSLSSNNAFNSANLNQTAILRAMGL